MTSTVGWLISRGRHAEALKLVARLHANGKEDDELVINSIQEMTTAIALEKQGRTTLWRALVATKGNRRRLLVITLIASGSQWLGRGILSCERTRTNSSITRGAC